MPNFSAVERMLLGGALGGVGGYAAGDDPTWYRKGNRGESALGGAIIGAGIGASTSAIQALRKSLRTQEIKKMISEAAKKPVDAGLTTSAPRVQAAVRPVEADRKFLTGLLEDGTNARAGRSENLLRGVSNQAEREAERAADYIERNMDRQLAGKSLESSGLSSVDFKPFPLGPEPKLGAYRGA